MEKKILCWPLPLKNLPPYVAVIKTYFGLSHPSLEMEMKLVEFDPEHTFDLVEYVLYDDVQAQIETSFPGLSGGDKSFVTNLLWLVANLYYGDSYNQYRGFIENDWNYEYNTWRGIEADMAQLYAFLHDHTTEKEITIQIGKDKAVIDDASCWFQGVMRNQVFPNCIPSIQSKEDAESLLRKKAGRPQTRTEVNAIVSGIASYFADEKLIEGKAPKNLLEFIRKFLVMMALIEENDVFVNAGWIKSQISNLQKSGKDARFINEDWVDASSSEALVNAPWQKAMRWIFPPKR
jgi:hypothetical protein